MTEPSEQTPCAFEGREGGQEALAVLARSILNAASLYDIFCLKHPSSPTEHVDGGGAPHKDANENNDAEYKKGFSHEALRSRYKQLCLKLHPDRLIQSSRRRDDAAADDALHYGHDVNAPCDRRGEATGDIGHGTLSSEHVQGREHSGAAVEKHDDSQYPEVTTSVEGDRSSGSTLSLCSDAFVRMQGAFQVLSDDTRRDTYNRMGHVAYMAMAGMRRQAEETAMMEEMVAVRVAQAKLAAAMLFFGGSSPPQPVATPSFVCAGPPPSSSSALCKNSNAAARVPEARRCAARVPVDGALCGTCRGAALLSAHSPLLNAQRARCASFGCLRTLSPEAAAAGSTTSSSVDRGPSQGPLCKACRSKPQKCKTFGCLVKVNREENGSEWCAKHRQGH